MAYRVELIKPTVKEKMMGEIYSQDLHERKAEIHGACVKLFTDSREFKDMWEDNFEPMPDHIRPHGRIFAVSDGGRRLRVLYEPSSKTVIIKNCDYYGWVKSVALGVVADFMEDFPSEHRRYSVHGSFVDRGGRGLCIVGPSKSGKTTLTYGLLLDAFNNYLTDDWFFVRFTKTETLAYSSEKNSYIRDDLAKNWPAFKSKLKDIKKDKQRRCVVDVKRFFGEDRIRKRSSLVASVLLTREKGKPAFRKLGRKEAIDFITAHDFCNPHQLVRNPDKIKKRKAFFRELFARHPVYLLNTVETPAQSLARLTNIIGSL